MEIIDLPYQQNSADLFAHFVHLPYAIFLDSCRPFQTQGRFDILSANPEQVITCDSNEPLQTDPFLQTQNALQDLKSTYGESLSALPFTIGALGYFGYGIGKRLENIPNDKIQNNKIPDGVIGIYHWSIVIDHQKQQTFLIAKDQETYRQAKKILETPRTQHANFSLNKPFEADTPKQQYQAAFKRLQKHIIDGDCYQANLCHRFSAKYKGTPWAAYLKLREKNPAPFAAYMHLPQGDLLSFSPERFLSVKGKQVQTKPIKGTSKRFDDIEKNHASMLRLLNSEKDKAENLMIVDLLRNDLGKCCKPGTIKVPELFALESFSNVHHLVSTVTGELEADKHSLDLLRSCFPGGSITGAPKIRAMQIIEQLETHPRSAYCGSFGYFDYRGNMDTNINIRSLICADGDIHCYSGGGIVADSECESEYQETLAKVGKLIETLENTMS